MTIDKYKDWIAEFSNSEFGHQAFFELDKLKNNDNFEYLREKITSICFMVLNISNGEKLDLASNYRKLDIEFLRDIDVTLNSVERLINFMKKHDRTPAYNELFFNRGFDIFSFKQMAEDFLSLSEGYTSIKPDATYRYMVGNLIYPNPVDTKTNNSKISPSSVLCLNLTILFRIWSKGERLTPFVPVTTAGGRPFYKLVSLFVSAVFPDKIETAETVKDKVKDVINRNNGLILSFDPHN